MIMQILEVNTTETIQEKMRAGSLSPGSCETKTSKKQNPYPFAQERKILLANPWLLAI